MKKLAIIYVWTSIVVMMTAPAFAIEYGTDFLEDGNSGGWSVSSKTFDDEWNILQGEEVDIDIWLNDCPEKMVTGSFYITYDISEATLMSVSTYDGNDLPGPWDSAITNKISEPGGAGTYWVLLGDLGCVNPDGGSDIILGKVRFRIDVPGDIDITIKVEEPDSMDVVVGCDTFTVYDSEISTKTVTIHSSSWHIETPDDGGNVLPFYTSIATDSENHPHISYSGGGIKYAWCEMGGEDTTCDWHIEPVDSSSDSVSSIAVDNTDNIHISYYDSLGHDLEYAYYDGDVWDKETVDEGDVESPRGLYSSIAVGSDNNPHISYYDDDLSILKYAYNDGSWHIQTLDSIMMACATSIALDSNNNPHIVYYDLGLMDLKWAWCDSDCGTTTTYWYVETVDSDSDVGWYPSVAVDSSHHPHVSYLRNNDQLKYAYYDGEVWDKQVVDDVGGVYPTSIVLDSSDKPHIGYQKYGADYAYYDGDVWYKETVDSDTINNAVSIVLDSNDNPHISYQDNTNQYLKYATTDNGDGDGAPDSQDNCVNHSNGPEEGTCVVDVSGVMVSYRVGDPPAAVTCVDDNDCLATGGFCQKHQGDYNENGIGDACEGYADVDGIGGVNLGDLMILISEYGRTDCNDVPQPNPLCQFDINDDGRVSAWDFLILLLQYGGDDYE